MGFDLEADWPDYYSPGLQDPPELDHASHWWRTFLLVVGVVGSLETVVTIGIMVVIAHNTSSLLYISLPAIAFAGSVLFLFVLGACVYRHLARDSSREPAVRKV